MVVITTRVLIRVVQTVPRDPGNIVVYPDIPQGRESHCIGIDEFSALGYNMGHYRSRALLSCKDGAPQERLVHVSGYADADFLASHKTKALTANTPRNFC